MSAPSKYLIVSAVSLLCNAETGLKLLVLGSKGRILEPLDKSSLSSTLQSTTLFFVCLSYLMVSHMGFEEDWFMFGGNMKM
jgi:hypothetical protein